MNDRDSRLLSEAYSSISQSHGNKTYIINGVEVRYAPSEDIEEDNIKIWHYFKDNNGNTIADFDYSSYQTPSPEIIQLWINLGCPTRKDIRNSGAGNGVGPITDRDLENYAKLKNS